MRFAGENMRKVVLKRPVLTKDDTGQRIKTYEDAADDPNPWASVRDQRGAEGYQSDKKTASAVKIFQIYARSDIDESWIIVDQEEGRWYDIQRIHRIGRRKLDIEAEWTQGKYNE